MNKMSLGIVSALIPLAFLGTARAQTYYYEDYEAGVERRIAAEKLERSADKLEAEGKADKAHEKRDKAADFYRELLLNRASVGEALRRAKVRARGRKGAGDAARQLTLASFVLYGDPTQQLLRILWSGSAQPSRACRWRSWRRGWGCGWWCGRAGGWS